MIYNINHAGFAELLLEAMAEGVFTLNGKGEVTLWNPSMERMTGYRADEAIGKTCSMLQFNTCFRQDCPSGFTECRVYTLGKVSSKECFLRHKEGHDVPVLKNARLLKNENGEVIGVVETLTDLTELYRMRQKAEEADRILGELVTFGNLIGKSHGMQEVFSSIKAASESDATVLVQGESGTGKELVAGSIHHNSSREERPLVIVNCSALSESLLESELFGHVKGAFTGALRDRAGRFEEADGGTLFLDEIGDISPYIQVKLLRVLQEREVERVGDSQKRSINIRIIAASNRDLYTLTQEGAFREDLYYRLKVFPINLPPLRERREDIPHLVAGFVDTQNRRTGKKIKGVALEAMRLLLDYNWPGNVRELENAIEHGFVLCSRNHIQILDLPVEIRNSRPQDKGIIPASPTNKPPHPVKPLNRDGLIRLLDACHWNKAEAGRQAGVSRTAIWKYMKKWDIPMKRDELQETGYDNNPA